LLKSELGTFASDDSADIYASVQPLPNVDGSYIVSYLATAAALYTIKGTLTEVGGLLATFYSSNSFRMMPTFDPLSHQMQTLPSTVCKISNLGTAEALPLDDCVGVPQSSLSATLVTAKFAGFIQPIFSETYTVSVISSDSVVVFVDGLRILSKASSRTSALSMNVEGTIAFQAMTVYPILFEYKKEAGAEFSIVVKWKSRSQTLEVLPTNRM
jgi:hypothetical protein